MKEATLMDRLVEAAGCEYISQLPYARITKAQAPAVYALAEAEYSIKEYNEAARYILHGLRRYSDPRDAMKDIVSQMLIRPDEFPYM